jgi:single-strand DNA-binding protein
MNSFTLAAVGHLARNPELVAKGDTAYTRFCLVGNDYAGKDEEGAAREVVTSLWFVAFGALGEAIARNSRKGDQLIVEARVRANIWTDKQGEKQYDHDFVVQGFRFGAPGRTKREERDARREDGHGLHRAEERGNGRDRSTNNGARTGLGAISGVVERAGFAADACAIVSAESGVVTDAGATADADTGAAADVGAADADAGVAADASAASGASSGASRVANARATAGRASEKLGGSRSSRRAAASAA